MVDVGFPREGVESRGWQLYIIGTVMVIVAGIFVALRLAARYQRDGIRVDDYTITAALVCLNRQNLLGTMRNTCGYLYGNLD